MVIQALKWTGSVVAAAMAGAIIDLFGGFIGLSATTAGIVAGFAIATSFQALKPSPRASRPTQVQRTQSARRYRQARSARQAQNR